MANGSVIVFSEKGLCGGGFSITGVSVGRFLAQVHRGKCFDLSSIRAIFLRRGNSLSILPGSGGHPTAPSSLGVVIRRAEPRSIIVASKGVLRGGLTRSNFGLR